MDWELAGKIEEALNGCTFRLEDMKQALTSSVSVAEDLCKMLERQDI